MKDLCVVADVRSVSDGLDMGQSVDGSNAELADTLIWDMGGDVKLPESDDTIMAVEIPEGWPSNLILSMGWASRLNC